MRIPFATNSYRSASLPLSAQRVVNLYPEVQPPNTKTQVPIFGSPGIVTFATAGSGPIRGGHVFGGVLHVVSGEQLYSVTSAGVATSVGSSIPGSGRISMADNGDELGMVNGTNGYIYSSASGFQLITDIDFTPANTIDFLDGFFIFDRIGTNEWFRSDLLDGTAYDSTAFATAESKSDQILSVRQHKQLAYLFGEFSIEPWQNVGTANFPWQRISGGTIDRGIIAAHAFGDEDESLFFVGEDRVAYRLGGTQLKRISTHAIEQEWQTYATVSDCFGLSVPWSGHKWIVFTFPTQAKTWVYDIATNMWHERESRDVNGTALGRWRANMAIQAYGKVFIGDAYSGKIGYLDASTYAEFGDPMYAEAVGTPAHADGKPIFVSEFRLEMETGVGLASGQGSDPQVMLDVSRDGGRTFDDQQAWQTAGKIGEYRTELRWRRLGNALEWLPRITISDPVKRVIHGATAEFEIGVD